MSDLQALAALLVEFSRGAARAEGADDLLPLLSSAAVEHVGADAAAVLKIGPDGMLRVVASEGLSQRGRSFAVELDAIDAELGEALRQTSGKKYPSALTFPLVSHQALFGALVLLYRGGREPAAGERVLAESLVDLAAMTMGRALQYATLQRAYDELRESREAQARIYKLSALGQMAAGVSHDLKNILNPLKIYTQLLERQVPKEHHDAHESIAEIHDTIRRGVETIDRLRDFSRQEPVTVAELTDVNAVVEEAVTLARARLVDKKAYSVSIRTTLGDAPPVRVIATELVNALVNLIVNAIDALDAGGSSIVISSGSSEGRTWMRVSDDGPGMPEDVARRVFEPFFTTKAAAGTGLGLANVYAFAKRAGGDIALDTAPGKGATFTLSFPAGA